MIHGILFPLYLLCLIYIAYANRWSTFRWIVGFLVGFLPFGTFIFTAYLNKKGWR
ncbi:hypothetical protein DCC85_10400 [Paenibacillus sp. CAA11]|uniref:DUF3817 domain-containing protein n=1 Tax=Paenibacillus sp. CAA11 TaxID=1532905 RepID=UPI000D3D5284|nr:hypothetical protein DCC85_10400 [Paenibacillus sp. CAA11]